MARDSHCTIIKHTKGKLPRLPFASIKEKILGSEYDLSISFISKAAQARLNKTYRSKNSSTNVLSFSLSQNSGEITFDLDRVRHDAPDFGMPYSKFLKYLFIHGLLHLKGFEHSSTMEKQERKYLKLFS